MVITELPVSTEVLLRPGPDDRPRSAGVHVSEIIRDISNTVIHKGQRRKFDELSDNEKARMGGYVTGGFAWERVLERSLSDAFADGSLIRPGEFTVDNIHCTPDLLDLARQILVEWKCTWRSSRRCERIEEDFWEWFVQIKAYLRCVCLLQAELCVYFVNGDYRDSGPQVKIFFLEFTQREIDENWNMLFNHAKRRGWLDAPKATKQ